MAMPSNATYITRARELAPLVRERAAVAEHRCRLTDDVVEAFWDSGLPRLLVIPELGGEGADPIAALQASQVIAAADPSAGWTTGFIMIGPIFGQLLPKTTYERIYSEPRGAIIGTIVPTSTARTSDGGFIFNGRSSYNSGHQLATHVQIGAVVAPESDRRPDGPPEMCVGVLEKDRVAIPPSWRAAGMRATGSDDVIVSEQFVPRDMTFPFPPTTSTWRGGAWGTVPFTTLVAHVSSTVVVGAARGSITAFREIATAKTPTAASSKLAEQPSAQIAVADAEGLCLAAEALLDDSVNALWASGQQGPPTVDDLARARIGAVASARLAKQASDLVADCAGMNTCLAGDRIERFSRDIRTMMQHFTIGPVRREATGRILLGLDPGSPIV